MAARVTGYKKEVKKKKKKKKNKEKTQKNNNSDRYIISLLPHLHTPLSQSLINLMVSVDVKHVYLKHKENNRQNKHTQTKQQQTKTTTKQKH